MTEFTEKQIEEMVNRFLQWRLPASVCSDLCVTDRTYAERYPESRSGTNLLTADEARQMITHVLAAELAPEPVAHSLPLEPSEEAVDAAYDQLPWLELKHRDDVIDALRAAYAIDARPAAPREQEEK